MALGAWQYRFRATPILSVEQCLEALGAVFCVTFDEPQSGFRLRQRWSADVDAEHGSKPRVLANALMHHLFVHATSTWVGLFRSHLKILVLELAPDAEDLHSLGVVPRPVGEGVLTARMWRGIVFVGVIMAAGTLFVLDAALPGGLVDGSGELPYAQTMAFTTLMLFQMFNVVNARSDERSAFVHLFTNRWLWAAVGGSIVLQVVVVYAPFLQRAFGTTALSARDWLFCVAVASSVLWLREASKMIARARR